MSKKSTNTQSFEHQGCKVTITAKGVEETLTIDGTKVPVERDGDTGAYASPDAPYKACGSIEELAKCVVSNRQEQ